jgi:hypothetical protein
VAHSLDYGSHADNVADSSHQSAFSFQQKNIAADFPLIAADQDEAAANFANKRE